MRQLYQRNRTIIFYLFLLLLIVNFSFVSCNKQSGEKFSFVFMTDIHLQPEGFAIEGFDHAINHINQLQPDFVITGGDLVMDALGQKYSRADSLYNLYIETVKKIHAPVYNTIGNHEVFGVYEKSGVSPDQPEYGKKMFRKRLGNGSTYHSFNYKGWHFMQLDGIGLTDHHSYYGHIDSTQIEWIKKDLAKVSPVTPIVVSVHIPFYSIIAQVTDKPTAANGEGAVITNGNEVLKLFNGHNLKMVLSGHHHWMEEIKFRGVDYINVPAVSAGWWRGPNRGFTEGFAVIDIDGDKFTWRYEDYGWHAPQKAENKK